MSDNSAIEWTDATWNPIKVGTHSWYCEKISPGCDNCYASTLTNRWGGYEYPKAGEKGYVGDWGGARLVDGVSLWENVLQQPLKWRKPRRIFVCSMTDLFGEWVTDAWLDRIFDAMEDCHWHTFQVLTKRPRRMREYLSRRWTGAYLPQFIWLGVTVEEDRYAWRARELAATPAAVRFVSAEPLLGPLPTLCRELGRREDWGAPVWHWVITGGESGPKHRPIDPDWVRDLRDRCQAAGVAFFHKQWGGRTPKAGGRLLDGREWSEFPAERSAVPS